MMPRFANDLEAKSPTKSHLARIIHEFDLPICKASGVKL